MKPTYEQALLLGTERLASEPTAFHPVLAEAWEQLDWAGSKEAALLGATALSGGVLCAGAQALLLGSSVGAADAESRPEAGSAATSLLPRLLSEEWRGLLPEWLELCAHRAQLVPPYYLPPVLDAATGLAERALTAAVGGARARWLADHNPRWSWLLQPTPDVLPAESVWETGTAPERLAWLAACRSRDPGRARAALELAWPGEASDFRKQALGCLREGLSLADESFLTKVLKEKRKDLRQAAQSLLVALPESGFSQRVRAAAAQFLRVERGFFSKKLEVQLPGAFEPAWRADAIEEKPPAGVGEKAFWVQQFLALTPVRHWARLFGLEPGPLVALAAASGDWSELVLSSWFEAVSLHREGDAARALLPVLFSDAKRLPPGTSPQNLVSSLLPLHEPGARWSLAASTPELAWLALPHLEGSPPPREARAVFSHIAPLLREGYNPGGSPAAVLAARRLPPEIREVAAAELARPNGLSKPAEAFLQALELRASLHQAFNV